MVALGLTGWISLISLALKFPSAVMAMIKIFQDTPSEHHQKLVQAMQAEADFIKKTGRPKWDQ